MKAFKYILFLILVLIIGFSIYVAVQPNTFTVERTRTIKAPSSVIYNNVIDFKNWESWSSWVEMDPDLKITYPEQTKGVGGSYTWEDKDGVGVMKTIHANEPKSIEQTMQFADFPASDVSWTFKPNGHGATDVTWKISGKDLPFGFKAFAIIMGGMEKQIGPHYERSLEKLDSVVVKSMSEYTVKVDGITEYGGGFYMFKTTSATSSNISNTMAKQYAEIMNYMGEHNIPQSGMPFTIYNEMSIGNGNVIMSNAIPVRDKVIIADDSNVLCGYMDKTRVLKTTLKGNYTNLGKAWEIAMKHLKDNNLEASEMKPFEIYTNDPGSYPNPSDWVTEIYIPIKEQVTETEQN